MLTGTDLGSRTLLPGVYRYATSAQLTGALTLDAGGDPNAQFIFQIGSTLTRASASSVVLVNGASACNVFWQIGSSATLGTATAFQGNVLASTAITVTSGTTLVGRALTQTAGVSLDTNVLTAPLCPSPVGLTPAPVSPLPVTPPPVTPPAGAAGSAPAGAGPSAGPGGTAPSLRRAPGEACVDPFHARVRGTAIASVAFRLDGKLIATRTRAPFSVVIDAGTGSHRIAATITFTDGTAARQRVLRYRRCAEATLRPRRGPSAFTG